MRIVVEKGLWLLCTLFVIGFILRFIGLDYGMPYLFHPDEVRQILDALSMGQRVSAIPGDLTYPALHKYVLLFVFGLYYGISVLLGTFDGPGEFAVSFLWSPARLFLLGRAVSLVFGLGVAFITYWGARRLFGQRCALLACALSLFTYQLIGHSQWATADIMLTFFTTTAFLLICLDMKYFNKKYFYLACVFVGLCISTKFQGVFVGLPLVVGQVFLIVKRKLAAVAIVKRVIVGGCLIFLLSSLGNIVFFVDADAYVRKVEQLRGVTQVGLSSSPAYTDGFLGLVLWFAKEMVRQELVLGCLIVLGIMYCFWRHDRYDIVSIGYLILVFFSMRNWGFRYLHLFSPCYGVMCLLAGRAISDLLDRAGNIKIRGLIYSVLIVGLVLGGWRGVDAGLRKMQDDTRILAKKWIEENVPSDRCIAIDWYVFGPPILSDIPIIAQSPAARGYYDRWVSLAIKDGYRKLQESEGLKKYCVVNIIYNTKGPVWPSEMPDAAVKKAEKMEVMRDLYRWFNFMTVEEMRKAGVEYVVISSYAYSHFLFDDDERKTGIFNPYIFEDMRSSNRQAEYYDDRSLNGLLFYLTKRARAFYLHFLDGHGRCRLVKEFAADGSNLGPTIRIYKLGI